MRKVATSNEGLKTLCGQLVKKIEINMAANKAPQQFLVVGTKGT